MHGQGKLTWPDGRSYKGNFVNDIKEGQGLFIWPDTNNKNKFRSYNGSWKNGKQHGPGIYKDTKGVEKEGVWECGKNIGWVKKDDDSSIRYSE